jgi:hypothetical protein
MIKAYVAVFVCMATKAIHLELVSDLSTPAFLGALNRFVSRRGYPSDIYSDEGTNFVGAKTEVAELRKLVTSSPHHDATIDFLTPKGIRFHTNPPAAPHHGGLWEAAVKSMKFHLRRVMGDRHLTTEEFTTLLCEIEAILNSRPLTPMSTEPEDLSALTPAHFLVGRPLIAIPNPDLSHVPMNRLSRWQLVQHIVQSFWKAWTRDYLNVLQSRPKWNEPLPDLLPGTLVLLLDKASAFSVQKWKLGRVIAVNPGTDDKTRVCDIKVAIAEPNLKNPKAPAVKFAVYRRPVTKISPLPLQ